MSAEDFMQGGRWTCIKCGACCRLVGIHPQARADHLDRGDGVCRHLTDTNECAIYDDRPDYCRTDRSAPATDRARASACSMIREAMT